jgi:plasmid stabilization system protein ParE
MKRYAVVFEESAQADVRESYDWGCRTWGKQEAKQWVRQLRTAVSQQLAIVPKGFSLAPEDDEFSEEISPNGCGPLSRVVYDKGT